MNTGQLYLFSVDKDLEIQTCNNCVFSAYTLNSVSTLHS